MKKDLIYILIIILLSVALWILWDSGKTSDLSRDLRHAQERIEAESRIAERDTTIARLQTKMALDSQNYAKEQAILKTQAKGLRRREILSRTDTVTITLTDSVYMADDALILSLTTERNAIRQDCKVLTDSLLANIDDFKTIKVSLETDLLSANQEVLKQKRRGRVFQVLFYVAAGWAVVETMKD